MLQILQLVEEGRADLLQEMLGQRLEFGVWVLGTRVVDGVMPGYRYSSCIYVISPALMYHTGMQARPACVANWVPASIA